MLGFFIIQVCTLAIVLEKVMEQSGNIVLRLTYHFPVKLSCCRTCCGLPNL